MAGRLISRLLVVLALVGAALSGCVQIKTTPAYARAGDHIVIALGGIERNVQGTAVLKPGDLTITLTDSAATPFTLEARKIFKSYSDYTSVLNVSNFNGSYALLGLTDMVPYDGGWYVLAPLTLPGQYDQPLPLALGTATIAVSSAKLTNTAHFAEGDLNAIPVEIIAGTSPEDPIIVGQFESYTPVPSQFIIAPDDLQGITEVGGAHLVIDYADDSQFQFGVEPQVLPWDHHPFVQVNYNVVPNGNGTGSIYVTLLNPAGFRTLATSTPNSSLLSHLTVSLLYFSSGSVAQAKANYTLNTMDSYYIRPDGTELGGLAPVMTHYDDY